MGDTTWAALVLAQPIDDKETLRRRRTVLDELRIVQSEEKAQLAPSPLAQHYSELLTALLKALTLGYSVGTWRTAVYLFGDQSSYHRLATLWTALYAGEKSLPEPLRVENAGRWPIDLKHRLSAWAMPDAMPPRGPGRYRHAFSYQTLLNSQQLASYISFPEHETPGFAINEVPKFDTEVRSVEARASVSLGQVVSRDKVTDTTYPIDLDALAKHAFVAGITGSGKTNTIIRLLLQSHGAGIHFLVIEPAKAEYRQLLNDPALGDVLQVFTFGNELASPCRLNPFEVPEGIPVGVHLDLLRSVFAASFGMWTPLPQILERCLYAIYADRGWDITADVNYRLNGGDRSAAFPTLSDLAAKVDEVTRDLGYEERIAADMRAALLTRIESLRTGGKGRMLDVPRSLPASQLFDGWTVIELEGLGDDDDKAFVMGLLFIRLVEHRRTSPTKTHQLHHLLVIEEAHRLLTNVSGHAREEEANPRGKAVETFANLLAEIRAYGQGVVVADQVPVKLAPDVIKNTGLKIAHRVVAADDRSALAGAMAMNERQAHALASLAPGRAAVFGDGDDAPLLVVVPEVKGDLSEPDIDQARVASHMAGSSARTQHGELFHSFPAASEVPISSGRAWDLARRIVESSDFQRLFARIVVSAIEDPNALDRHWSELTSYVRTLLPAGLDESDLTQCVVARAAEWLAERRGAQAGWSYGETRQFADGLRAALLAMAATSDGDDVREAFQEVALRIHARPVDPFPACSRICSEKPARCLYRHAAADLMSAGDLTQTWRDASAEDAGSSPRALGRSWAVCERAGTALTESPEADWPAEVADAADAAARRASLCFGQQMIFRELSHAPRFAEFWIDELVRESDRE